MLDRLRDTQTTHLIRRPHVAVAYLYLRDSLLPQVYQYMKAKDARFCFYETMLKLALGRMTGVSAESSPPLFLRGNSKALFHKKPFAFRTAPLKCPVNAKFSCEMQ